jgi:hypothetical protein
MSRPHALAAAILCTLLSLTLVPSASADGSGETGGPSPLSFIGQDGLLYLQAPQVVTSADGQMYLGADFDTACHGAGGLEERLKDLAKLAKVIRKSGRKVVFTVAPSKTLVMSPGATADQYPHGVCDETGLAKEQAALDSFSDSAYLPMRRPLLAQAPSTYWRTDPHWTTVGGSIYAHELARKLDPRLARRQKYSYGTDTALGLFSLWLGNPTPETAPTAQPAYGITSRTVSGSRSYAGFPDLVFDHSWASSPARKTWGGQSLLIGDSFTLWALESLRPVFRHGRYLWADKVAESDLVQAIHDSDTVVIEVVSFGLATSLMATSQFRHAVARAVR